MSDFRPSRFQILPMVVKNLLIINGLFFLATVVLQNNYGFDLTEYLGLHFFTSQYFRPHQLVTHMFMHGSFIHIFSNMFALWMFGSVIENVWGPKRFLIFYFVCGLGGALCHLGVTAYQIHLTQIEINNYMASPDITNLLALFKNNRNLIDESYRDEINKFLITWQQSPTDSSLIFHSKELAQRLTAVQADIPVIGASGAVFGVLLAFGMMFPNTYLYVYLFLPVKAKYFVILYMAFELYAGISGTQAGVAHFAHLGGALFGYIMIRYWNKNRRQDFF